MFYINSFVAEYGMMLHPIGRIIDTYLMAFSGISRRLLREYLSTRNIDNFESLVLIGKTDF